MPVYFCSNWMLFCVVCAYIYIHITWICAKIMVEWFLAHCNFRILLPLHKGNLSEQIRNVNKFSHTYYYNQCVWTMIQCELFMHNNGIKTMCREYIWCVQISILLFSKLFALWKRKQMRKFIGQCPVYVSSLEIRS